MAQATARRFRKLLTPVSFTEKTDAIFAYSRRIAQVNEGNVTLLHVVPTQSYRLLRDVYHPERSGGANADYAANVARELLEKTAAEKLTSVPVEIVVRHGANPAKTVLEVHEEISPDLIVVGKSEFGEIGARLQGGLAEKLIRGAKCPVWSVSALEQFARQESVKSVLAPIEFGRAGITVARAARLVAEPQRGNVILLHVILVDPSFLELNRAVYGFGSDEPLSIAKAQRAAQKRLEAMAAEHLAGIPHEIVVSVGSDRSTTILDEERVREPSLIIVMAPPEQSLFFQIVLGSDAETIARRAACSVVTLRPAAD
jgi:nucleotide-binding universal stress UspA family protein